MQEHLVLLGSLISLSFHRIELNFQASDLLPEPQKDNAFDLFKPCLFLRKLFLKICKLLRLKVLLLFCVFEHSHGLRE